jgi:ABC-type nitrate/sulfonate/bicarbonate transport system substrate-binding protein
MDHVSFPYRSRSHLALLHVISQSGAWEKHGLEVDYNKFISSEDSHRDLPTGAVEFVGGNHVSTYAHRARGDKWVYLGQTVSCVNHSLCVRPDSGIFGIQDLREKKFVVGGSHPSLNDWLFLKQRGLDVDRDDYEMINAIKVKRGSMDAEKGVEPRVSKWEWVKSGKADACFLTPLQSVFARKDGLRLINLETMPMINFTTVSTSMDFAEKHPDVVERFLKGILEGIAFFKTQPEPSKRMIKECGMAGRAPLDDEMVDVVYNELARIVDPRLYPAMDAITNVYQEAIRQDADAKKVSPLSLWDMHYIRRIDDSGFIDALYGNQKPK